MKVYISSIRDFSGLPGLELISALRRERLDKFNMPEDKQRCLMAGLLLRYVLGEESGSIVTTANGKPYIPGGPCFNISHSGEYVVLAVGEQDMGVDIERIGTYRDKLARRCCTAEEYAWLCNQPPETFYKVWTGKECIMKATGQGLSLPAGSFSVLPLCDGLHNINGLDWYMRWLEHLPGYAMCLASALDEEPEIYFPSPEELLHINR